MKIAIITDQHFGVRSDSSYFLDRQEKFYQEVFFPTLKAEGVEVVLDGGDAYDHRKYVNLQTLDRAEAMFYQPLAQLGIPSHHIAGNHNVFYRNTNRIDSNTLFDHYPNVHTYRDHPVELEFGGCKFLLVPWLNKENVDLSLEMIAKTTATHVLGHFEIQGAEMLKGSVCKHGLQQNLFARFDKVYSGHFHHPSKLGNIQYLGAPYEMVWSDYEGSRGFSIFDTETREIKHINNPHTVFEKVEYDDTDMSIAAVEQIDFSSYAAKIVKVLVHNKTSQSTLNAWLSKLDEVQPHEVKVVEDLNALNPIPDSEVEIDNLDDTNDIIKKYVGSLGLEPDRQKQALTLLDDLHKQAIQG